MGELDNDEFRFDVSSKTKKSRKRSRSIVDDTTQVINDDVSNSLPEHSISKKKKKKKKRINDEETVDKEENTQKENHQENTNQVTECNDDVQKTNEITGKKGRKSSRKLSPLGGDGPEHSEMEIPGDSCNSEIKKKRKEKEKILTKHSGINTIIHHKIENLGDDSNDPDFSISLENYSGKLSINGNRDSKKPETSYLEKIEGKRKKSKKMISKELMKDTDPVTDSNIDGEQSEDRISPKLKKRKSGKLKDREKEKSHNGSEQPPMEEVRSEFVIDLEHAIKKEKFSDEENQSDSSDGIIFDDGGRPTRVKKSTLTTAELRLARIVAYDKSDDEEEIHPMQQHHPLDPEDAAKLADIHIKLKHDVPPQHKVEKLAGTRVPTKEEKDEMQKYVEMKKGPFNIEEDRKIQRNWRKFCKRYDWDAKLVSPFLFFKQKGFFYVSEVEERKKFVQLLAKGLPNRTLYSVYHRFRILYSNHKQERYSPAEDRELLRSIQNNLEQGEKPNYAILAKKFNRTRASVWRRYVLLMKKRQKETDSN